MKGNRKGFCKCITKENEGLLNEEVDLVTEDTEKAKVLSDLFVLVSTGKTNLQEFLVPESSEKVWSNDDTVSGRMAGLSSI